MQAVTASSTFTVEVEDLVVMVTEARRKILLRRQSPLKERWLGCMAVVRLSTQHTQLRRAAFSGPGQVSYCDHYSVGRTKGHRGDME